MNSHDRRKLARQKARDEKARNGEEKNDNSPKSGGFGGARNGEQGSENVTTCPPDPDGRGRPPVLDAQLKGEVIGLVTAGVSQRTAAAYVGISHSTISKAIARDEDFARQITQARAAARVHLQLQLVKASRKDWRAALRLLKRTPPEADISLAEEVQARSAAHQVAEEESHPCLERTAPRPSCKSEPPTQQPTTPPDEAKSAVEENGEQTTESSNSR